MFFYNIMASHKTNKRSYKKRTPKRKTQKGGDIKMFGYTCTKNKEEPELDEEQTVDETPEVDEEQTVDETPEVDEEQTVDETPEVDEDDDEVDSDDEEQGGNGKKGRKARKSTKKGRKPHKKNRKTMKKKGKSAWTTFVVELYRKNKQKNPVYMFKNALKDAAKIYKK